MTKTKKAQILKEKHVKSAQTVKDLERFKSILFTLTIQEFPTGLFILCNSWSRISLLNPVAKISLKLMFRQNSKRETKENIPTNRKLDTKCKCIKSSVWELFPTTNGDRKKPFHWRSYATVSTVYFSPLWPASP